MDIKLEGANTVVITGNIKSLEDYGAIKDCSQRLVKAGETEITFDILDSMSMVSSVIGYLIKLINVENVTVKVNVGDDRLYSLLDQLALIQTFKVTKK